jgi:hypothetical protein
MGSLISAEVFIDTSEWPRSTRHLRGVGRAAPRVKSADPRSRCASSVCSLPHGCAPFDSGHVEGAETTASRTPRAVECLPCRRRRGLRVVHANLDRRRRRPRDRFPRAARWRKQPRAHFVADAVVRALARRDVGTELCATGEPRAPPNLSGLVDERLKVRPLLVEPRPVGIPGRRRRGLERLVVGAKRLTSGVNLLQVGL